METNRRYHDVLTRHQIYVECVKLGIAASFNAFAAKLILLIRVKLAALSVKTLDQLTKAELNALIRDIHAEQAKLYAAYGNSTLSLLQSFADEDMAMTKFLFAYLDAEGKGESLQVPDKAPKEDSDAGMIGSGLFGLLLLAGSKAGSDRLWTTITNAVLPANGVAPLSFLNGSVTSAMASVESEIRKGFANRAPVGNVITTIVGTTARNNQDGVIARVYTQQNAVTNTLVQHVSSIVQAAVMSAYFDRYIWSSVIDGKTTQICLDRNGNVYVFGEGPIPPAHIGCRSDIVPDIGADDPPESYFAFLKSQPQAFLSDILAPSKLAALQNGKLRAKDIPRFDDAKPITLDAFATKLPLILNP
jgi:SPP1 gp7 family putative phage head morphogenesis protein